MSAIAGLGTAPELPAARAPRMPCAWRSFAVAVLLVSVPRAARADGPEQLEQLEPSRGQVLAEYFGAYGGDGSQSGQILWGASDHLAIGAEVETLGPAGGSDFDSVGVLALYRFSDPEAAPVGVGMEANLGIDRGGRLSNAEGRLIVERRGRRWWLQADLILRHAREADGRGTGLAYSSSVSRGLGGGSWLGLEASGQFARLSGEAEAAPTGRHYLGPSLTLETGLGESEIELGAAWLERIGGDGPGSGPRIFVQLGF